jgi:hypothetical protein
MRWVSVLMLGAIVTTLPNAADAQRRNRGSLDWGPENRFSLDAYGGGLKDAYDVGATDDVGYVVGLRVGYVLAPRTRFVGNLGYSYSDDVADNGSLTNYYVYDNVWVLTTGGLEFDVVPGNTSASLSLEFGVGWRKLDLDETVGSPTFPAEATDRYTAYEVLVPGFTMRHRLNSHAAFVASVHDYIFNLFDGTAKHSPALTFGLSFR